jgi:hypothetical protein
VLANVFTILLAGQDTTASTIAWVAYFMASHPEVQRKMQEEVDAVIAPAAMLEDFDAGDALLYLNAVINEAMRLKSVTPVLAVEPNYDVQVGDIAIPKGAVLSLLTREAGLQQGGNSAVDVFDPDRWLTGASAASHHRAGFMPFGSGPPGTQPRFDGSEIGSGHAVPQLRPVAGQRCARGRGSVRVFDGAAEPARRTASAGLVDPSTQVRLPSVRDNRADAKLHGALTTARRATHTTPPPR